MGYAVAQGNVKQSCQYRLSIRSVNALLALSVFLVLCGCSQDIANLKRQTFATIERIRIEKRSELEAHFLALNSTAKSGASDSLLLKAFDVLYSSGNISIGQRQALELQVDKHFVNRYDKFYDLLFVDSSGFIFHSIRKESDYHTCIFSDTLPASLSQKLRGASTPTFVDFEYYRPSDEPAAFHIIPIVTSGLRQGWLVFQQAINRVNTILTNRQGMGRTGEVYLVNSNGLMLSDSRFIRESIILRKRIDHKALGWKGAGNRLLTDYRGVVVFSSFEQFQLLGTSWHILAEIDEAEILTAYYRENETAFLESILKKLQSLPRNYVEQAFSSDPSVRVDMGEFGFVNAGTRLRTHGVATCTAVAISYPGRFSYLAHLPPTEVSYADGGSVYAYGEQTDMLQRVLKRIMRFDIYPYEMDSLKCTIVATHDDSAEGILSRLSDYGLMLSQIKFILNTDAVYANVVVEADCRTVVVEWVLSGSAPSVVEQDSSSLDLGRIVKAIVGYNSQRVS